MDPMKPYNNWNGGQQPMAGQPLAGEYSAAGQGAQPQQVPAGQNFGKFVPPSAQDAFEEQNAYGGFAPPPPVYPANSGGGNGGSGSSGKNNKNPYGFALTGISLAFVILSMAILVLAIGGISILGKLTTPAETVVNPPNGSFSVISVIGTIQNYGSDSLGVYEPSYRHTDTVSYIKNLADDPGDKGILLRLDTPGGGVFESDEVYLALMEYKEKTGRPVWAYMSQTCASGGYYICAAADYIMANRNTTTGSIGVYISMSDTSGLYEKLGIETVVIKSGDNKGTGISGAPITEGQRDVYQSIVDESYQQFVDIIVEGRGMPKAEVLALADGRVYSGRQAMENGLVDELGDWETCVEAFKEETDARAFYPSFSQRTLLGQMLGGLVDTMPVGDTEAAIREAEKVSGGVPMVMYNAEVWP